MKLLLYPYNQENRFLLLKKDFPKITGICIGREQKSSEYTAMKQFKVHNLLFECVDEYEGIIFYPSEKVYGKLKERFMEEMVTCIKKKKHVFCIMQLTKEELSTVQESLEDKEINLFHNLPPYCFKSDLASGEGRLYTCGCPVIFIGELCIGMQVEEVIMKLYNTFEGHGYKVEIILDNPCADLMGMYTTPSFIYENIAECDKILRFNHYIQKIYENDHPDVIFVQIPGNVLPLCEDTISDFAIFCFYYSRALKPDLFYCLLPSNLSDDKTVAVFHNDLKSRYGFGFDGVFVSGKHLDLNEASRNGSVEYITMETGKKESKILTIEEDSLLVIGQDTPHFGEQVYSFTEEVLATEFEVV